MFKMHLSQLKTAFIFLLAFTVLTGVIYPLLITGIAQLLFPKQANGSLLWQGDKIIGSEWIGQFFSDPRYFWGRPSATQPFPYNAEASSGSNMGPSNPAFLSLVKHRTTQIKIYSKNHLLVPVDLVTASASGLDPEISPLAALYQVPRIAKLRRLKEKDLQKLIQKLTKKRTLGILGEPRVNVLALNLALDKLQP